MSLEMDFITFRDDLIKNFEKMCENKHIYKANIDKDKIRELYLDSFPQGTNQMFNVRREYDCSCCLQFIKNVGGIITIDDDYKVHTLWEFKTEDKNFQVVIDALDEYVKSCEVKSLFITNIKKYGSLQTRTFNPETRKTDVFDHFTIEIPKKHILANKRDSLGTLIGDNTSLIGVFHRGLSELTLDSLETVQEFIDSNSLHRGTQWKQHINKFIELKKSYDKLEEKEQQLFAVKHGSEINKLTAGIRNTSIGTLLQDLSTGEKSLEKAVADYEYIVGDGYKRSKPIYTKKQLENAQKKLEEMGLIDSLQRKFATVDDLNINNLLFCDKSVREKTTNVFEEMKEEVAVSPKNFDKAQEMSIKDFVDNVLSSTKEMSLLVENKHNKNFMSLIGPEDKETPSLFKWDNAYSWAYAGNLASSSVKENVKNAGGKIDGVLRFSIQWNDSSLEHNKDDLDAHCIEPNGKTIYFSSPRNYETTGELDIDIQHPTKNVAAVENITYQKLTCMPDGDYKFRVHQYMNRGGRTGFCAEIEFDGQIHHFEYRKPIKTGDYIDVAIVTKKNGSFTIKPILDSTTSSKEVWGIKTQTFIPVRALCYSPNHWGDNNVGDKHLFFLLKGCKNEETPNSFYNEFLKEDFRAERKFFEALGAKLSVTDKEEQLSGVGFSLTKRDSVIVQVVSNNIKRMIKVNF